MLSSPNVLMLRVLCGPNTGGEVVALVLMAGHTKIKARGDFSVASASSPSTTSTASGAEEQNPEIRYRGEGEG